MEQNICKFFRSESHENNLHILNQVYEKEAAFRNFSVSASFSCNLVTVGRGILHTCFGCYPLTAGDIFIKLPAKQYYIENTANLQFMYISFIGDRSNYLLEYIHFIHNNPVYHGYDSLIEIWKDSFGADSRDNSNLEAEGLLLYTFSKMQKKQERETADSDPKKMAAVKQYLDEHYTDPQLSMESLSTHFSYNYKYLSHQFKQEIGVSFGRYLMILRLENALQLMVDGFTSIKEISSLSGFRDPLYFSKVFKEHYKKTPRDFICQLKQSAEINTCPKI